MGSRAFQITRTPRSLPSTGSGTSASSRVAGLAQPGQRAVQELAAEADLSVANASSHLQVLRHARLIEADKRGVFVAYRLGSPDVGAVWQALRDLGALRPAQVGRLVETYFADRTSLTPVGLQS